MWALDNLFLFPKQKKNQAKSGDQVAWGEIILGDKMLNSKTISLFLTNNKNPISTLSLRL